MANSTLKCNNLLLDPCFDFSNLQYHLLLDPRFDFSNLQYHLLLDPRFDTSANVGSLRIGT